MATRSVETSPRYARLLPGIGLGEPASSWRRPLGLVVGVRIAGGQPEPLDGRTVTDGLVRRIFWCRDVRRIGRTQNWSRSATSDFESRAEAVALTGPPARAISHLDLDFRPEQISSSLSGTRRWRCASGDATSRCRRRWYAERDHELAVEGRSDLVKRRNGGRVVSRLQA